MKVIIKDFQAVKEAVLEFGDGITIITGPNGSGKSATFRAIRAAISNPNGCAGYVNHDAKQAEVTIENNGQSITWTRTNDTSIYKNNLTGAEFVKASKMDSRDLGDLGFYFDLKDRLVNIPSEWDTLFPFGESDSEMFKLFEDIFNISSSFLIVDSFKAEEAEIKKSILLTSSQRDNAKHMKDSFDFVLGKINKEKLDELRALLIGIKTREYEMADDLGSFYESYPITQIVLPQKVNSDTLTYLESNLSKIREMEADLQEWKSNAALDSLDLVSISPDRMKIDLNPTLMKLKEMEKDLVDWKFEIGFSKMNGEKMLKLTQEIKEAEASLAEIIVCPTCGKEF